MDEASVFKRPLGESGVAVNAMGCWAIGPNVIMLAQGQDPLHVLEVDHERIAANDQALRTASAPRPGAPPAAGRAPRGGYGTQAGPHLRSGRFGKTTLLSEWRVMLSMARTYLPGPREH